MPPNFSWVIESRLAAHGFPASAEDVAWLRAEGIEVLISLTESPPTRTWVNEAGLLHVHVPVPDMAAPTDEQFDRLRETISKAEAAGMGVAIHCRAGYGRTGTVLAMVLVEQGERSSEAIRIVRNLRPGSIETRDQEDAVHAYARRKQNRG